jgi:plastocyanin
MRDRRGPVASAPALALVALLLLGGCTSGQGSAAMRRNGDPRFTVDPDGILRLADDSTKPYGVTAIDYHFHDAHPTLPLAPDRTILVTNEGRVRHNVSIPGTDFTKDIEPGDRIVLRGVGELFGGPGTHVFICRYHASLGMKGTVIVADR